jgi:hypothetical protein
VLEAIRTFLRYRHGMMYRAVGVVMVSAFAGCGGASNAPADGGVAVDSSAAVDAVVDSSPPPPPTRVRVVMFSQGRPVADVPVVFQRSDDTVVADVKTDAQGVADVEFPEGGSTVSLLPIYSDRTRGVITYLGVKPGDVLEVGSKFPETTFVGNVTLQLPPLPDGSRSYTVVMRCSTVFDVPGPSVTLRPCGSPTNFLVRDDNHHSFYTDLMTLHDGQTVDLTAGVFRGTRTLALRAENVLTPKFGANGDTYTSDWLMPLSSDQSLSIPIKSGVGTAEFAISDIPTAEVTADLAIGTAAGTEIWYRRQAPTSPFVFDFSQTGVAFITTPTYAGNTLSWSEQGTGGDLAYALVFLKNPAGAIRVDISIFGAKTGHTLRVPTFPAPYADRNRIPGDVSQVFRAGIARASGGWDAVRRYAQLDDFFRLDWLHGDFVISEGI